MRMKRHNGHGRFYCLILLLMTLIIVRYSLQTDVPRVVFLGIILLVVALGDRDEIAAMCICCIPLHESVDFFYAVVICVAGYMLKYPKSIRINLFIFPILLMVLWELLHCFGKQFSIVEFITNIVPLLALAIFMSTDTSELDYGFIVRAVSLTAVLAGISLLIKVLYLADFNIASAFAQLQRLGLETEKTEISGGTINPNTLGIICVLTATGLMQLRTAGRGNKKDLFLTIMLLVLGTLTSSRTFLVCLALMVVLLLFSQKGSIGQKIRFLGSMILVLVLTLVLLGVAFPELLEYFYGRFQVKDITTGRMGLMSIYHEFIMSSPKVFSFGIGLHNFIVKVTEVYRVSRYVPHNGIQELMVAWGLPGVILFGLMFLCMIWRSKQMCKRQMLINYIPLLVILAKVQAGQMLNSAYTMLAFSYAYLSMCTDMEPGGAQLEKKLNNTPCAESGTSRSGLSNQRKKNT